MRKIIYYNKLFNFQYFFHNLKKFQNKDFFDLKKQKLYDLTNIFFKNN